MANDKELQELQELRERKELAMLQARKSSFQPKQAEMDSDDPEQSKITAANAGAIQGATLGFGDELGALGSTALSALSGRTGPLAGGSLSDVADDYRFERDRLRALLDRVKAANPKTFTAGEFAGGLASGGAMGAPSSLKEAALQGARLGAVGGLGSSDADLTKGDLDQAIGDVGKGIAIGGIGGGAAYGIGKGVSSLLNGSAESSLRDLAESKALSATGATGKQMSKFQDGAGRELLDRGIVKFGDTPSDVARRAEEALAKSRDQIGSSLESLDKGGANLSREDLLTKLQSKIDDLKLDPSQNGVVKQLRGIMESVSESPENVTLSAAEKTKRGFQDLSNYNDPVATRANKTAADIYRTSVEGAAQGLNPELADTFLEGKKTFGLIDPIREAAERRAATLNQSPVGGLLDATSAAAGFMKGGPIGAVAAPIARRVIAPRAASSIAVGADKIADLLSSTPDAFGKFAPILQDAASRGSRALTVANYMLQKNPEYQQVLSRVASNSIIEPTKPDIISPELVSSFQKNPSLLASIKDESLREKLREHINSRSPAEDGVITDQEAQQRFINSN